MLAGKATTSGTGNAAGAPQFVSLDQLAALLQEMNHLPVQGSTNGPGNCLAEDGVNWPDWDAAITATITRVFEFKVYLVTNELDPSHDQAALTGVLVEHSIHPTLVASVWGKTGQAAFHVLQKLNVDWEETLEELAVGIMRADNCWVMVLQVRALGGGLPPQEAKKAPGLLKKPQALATVASVKRQPGRKEQGLINSGATDSVTNNVLFFTSMSPVSMSLIFASTDQFPVRQIGDVLLLTQYGRLKISNVLYCPNCQNDNTVAMHSAEIVMRSICDEIRSDVNSNSQAQGTT
ncbi:hypothetical protein PCANC_18256 [Puccinia coronata f. sp. avenae]|uniref:Retrovirus-related Pol polyprotein from transposon TNT 1-94-like beta-barrel domain-containing protein n=1 Tax=Puccinia coronata f. sp. avenae TaxID=200324 RepID=A0A2N5UR94_9BASI|nr:hypothetical protein PCANC_18256 [Puccinia coronata f. sp. avenae]